MLSVLLIGFSGTAVAAGPSISSVDVPDPSLVGTETAEVHVSGTVDTGIQYDHYLVLYEKNPNNILEDETRVNGTQFTPSDSSFEESLEFEVPNDENGEDHEYQVELVQEDTFSIFNPNTSVRSNTYNKFVVAPDSEDPDPQMISTDERRAPDSYIYYNGDADSRETTTYDINDPPTIHPGETVTIDYYVRNEGGTAGEHSAIQMQFRSLDQQSDKDQFTVFSGGLTSNQYTIGPGDTVFNQDGTKHDDGASSWQFERGLDFVNSGSEYGFSADVTPEETGEFTVLVRATYTDDTAQEGEANQESTWGSGKDPDQNGYNMKEIAIDVEPRNQEPSADAGGPYDVQEGGSVNLDASGATDPDGYISSESWTVTSGDGYVSDETYYAPNDITSDDSATIELTVEDDDEATDADTASITINDNNQPPNAEANGDYTVNEAGSVTLESAGTSDPDGTVVTESWAVANGPGSVSGSTYEAPSDITENKTATVKLTAEDDDGDTAAENATVTVIDDNQPPTAKAGGPYSVNEGESITLDSSGSTDSDGSIASTSWTITKGDGSVSGGTYYAPDTITSDNSATVKLTVEDDDRATNTDTTSIEITDDNQPPTADAGGPYSASEGDSVELDASGSNDPDGTIRSRSWMVTSGQGSISSGTYQAPSDISSDTEATVELTVTDNDGAPATDTATVSIGSENAPPTASDVSVSTLEDTSVSGTFSASDPDGDSLSYAIESRPTDGTVSVNGDSFSYTPESISSGTDSFTYRVDDGNNGTNTASVTIDVSPSSSGPSVSASNGSGSPGSSVTVTIDAENAQTVQLSNVPSNWTLAEKTTDGAVFNNGIDGNTSYLGWVWSSDQLSTNVSVTFEIPSNTDSDTFTMDVTTEDSTGETVSDSTTVSVSQSVVDEYDTNGEPGIQIEELNSGIDDYFIDEISIQELNTLIDAYFQQL